MSLNEVESALTGQPAVRAREADRERGPTEDAVSEAVLDDALLGRLESLQVGFVAELSEVFFVECIPRLAALNAAAKASDPNALFLAAHSLKGAAANLGLRRVFAACERLEEMGRSGRVDGTAPILERLGRDMEDARVALSAFRPAP